MTKEDTKNNLYPYYKKYDLRFLIGVATIYNNKLLNTPVIHFIEGTDIGVNFDDRLIYLFKIKEKWRIEELILFLDCIGIAQKKLIEKIRRKTNPIEDISIFDKDKKFSAIYLKKNLK